LAQAALWQRKEYRWDRYRDALLNTDQKYLALGYLITVGILSLSLLDIPFVALVSGLIIATYQIYTLLTKGIDRPKLTSKMKLILLTSLVLIGLIFISNLISQAAPVKWMALILGTPILTALAVWAVNIATKPRRRYIIAQAKSKRARLSKLTVIGITGSYGKTSTKHFLSQIMPQAVYSDQHRNSELTIAQNMLSDLNNATDVFVSEMGAYTQGEIAALANLTQPNIGLITNIGNQHLALFGSLAKILNAKWELIESLPDQGLAVLNIDDPLLVKKSTSYHGKIIWYSITKPADVYAKNIKVNSLNIQCQVSISGQSTQVTIPLAGLGALCNVMAAVALAHAAGQAKNHILNKLKNLKPYPHTMEIIQGKNGATIIDDSYTANEQGVMNAIEHLAKFNSQDKRIIMVPLIELGTKAPEVHQHIGAALAKSGAEVFIYHKDFKEDIIHGGRKIVGDFSPNFFTDPYKLREASFQNISKISVVLLEGRLPPSIIDYIS